MTLAPRFVLDAPNNASAQPAFQRVDPEHTAAPPAEIVVIDPLWTHPTDGLPCVLADLPDGRRLARRVIPGARQKPIMCFWKVDRHDMARPPVPLNNVVDPMGLPYAWLEQLRGCSPNGEPGYITKATIQEEADRFAAAWPNLAHHLGLTRLVPARVFDPGVCYRPHPGPTPPRYDLSRTGEIDFAAFRDRHCSGDHGAVGMLADAPPLTPVATWLLPLQSTLVQNAEAIQNGLGSVRSDYSLIGPQGHRVAITAITALHRDVRANFTVFKIATTEKPVATPAH